MQTINDTSCNGILLEEEYHAEDALNVFQSTVFSNVRLSYGVVADEECLPFIGAFLCLLQFPPCNVNTSELLPICLDRCPEIQAAYRRCFLIPDFTLVIENFNCSVHETYYITDDNTLAVSNTSCCKLYTDPVCE